MDIFDKIYLETWSTQNLLHFFYHCPVVLKYKTNKVQLSVKIALQNMVTIERK